MAMRIHDHVLRGEIDCRVKGVVRGRIWIKGLKEAVQLELMGNACRDLAGCLLRFHNPGNVERLPSNYTVFPIQEGSIGDLTASRKVRVFDVPIEEALRLIEKGEKPPEHRSNSLYLEWFSKRNGRVVIESADYELEISEPEWQLTEEEETQRAEDARAGLFGFMDHLNTTLENAREKVDYDKEEWDEFDYENFLKESDARMDKYMELYDKYGETDESEEIISREMGWNDLDAEEEDTDDTDRVLELADSSWNDHQESSDFLELKPDPATEGIDWIRTEDGDTRHPLQHRCFQGAITLGREIKDLQLSLESESLAQLRFEYQATGVKLAGALNDLAYGRNIFSPAFTAACLKRTLNHLHAVQNALAKVRHEKSIPADITDRVSDEFFEIREGILKLLDEFRGRS